MRSFSGEAHQKVTSKKSVPLSGGIFLFSAFLISFYSKLELIFIFYILVFFVIGILSDINVLKSAKKRLIIQMILIFLIIITFDIQIMSTRIYILDYLLSYEILNYCFVTFCLLIIVNGTNFLDGLNTLVIGYYLMVTLVLSNIDNLIFWDILHNTNYNIISILLLIYFFNFFNKLYLGDSGSYFLAIIYSLLLISLCLCVCARACACVCVYLCVRERKKREMGRE